MTGFLKYEEKENEFKNYIGKYVEIGLLPMGQTFYGKLKSFDKRVAILNPHKGQKVNNGKLENALISDEGARIELVHQNIYINKIGKEVIEEYCKNGNLQLREQEKQFILKNKTDSSERKE